MITAQPIETQTGTIPDNAAIVLCERDYSVLDDINSLIHVGKFGGFGIVANGNEMRFRAVNLGFVYNAMDNIIRCNGIVCREPEQDLGCVTSVHVSSIVARVAKLYNEITIGCP